MKLSFSSGYLNFSLLLLMTATATHAITLHFSLWGKLQS